MRSDPLLRRLALFLDLSGEERRAVEGWCANAKIIRKRKHFIRDGDRPETVCIILDGWACRYKDTKDGNRQIVGFLLPGDMCDPHAFILNKIDYNVSMLTDTLVASLSRSTMLNDIERYPRLTRALWWLSLVDEGICRAWLTNNGQRSASDRMAHLFCELWERTKLAGFSSDESFRLPITQIELAQALAMTPVHANRTLKVLRDSGLVSFVAGEVIIENPSELMATAGFRGDYLQVERRVL